jgi:hypothetical protein
MNGEAIRVWQQMGKTPVIGAQARPPHAALPVFGVPFSK